MKRTFDEAKKAATLRCAPPPPELALRFRSDLASAIMLLMLAYFCFLVLATSLSATMGVYFS